MIIIGTEYGEPTAYLLVDPVFIVSLKTTGLSSLLGTLVTLDVSSGDDIMVGVNRFGAVTTRVGIDTERLEAVVARLVFRGIAGRTWIDRTFPLLEMLGDFSSLLEAVESGRMAIMASPWLICDTCLLGGRDLGVSPRHSSIFGLIHSLLLP